MVGGGGLAGNFTMAFNDPCMATVHISRFLRTVKASPISPIRPYL